MDTDGTTTPDLAALAAQITTERSTAAEEARKTLLADLGFVSVDALSAFVEEQRRAETERMSEAERREQEAEAAKAAAAAAIAAAKATTDANTITAALMRAGVAPDVVTAARPLVVIEGDVTDQTADAAIVALKANPAFASIFGVQAPASTTTAPTEKGKPSPIRAYERGVERAKASLQKGRPSWT